MMIIVICSVKGISAQNPAPHVSTSRIGDWRTAGSTAHAATSTTKGAASANTNAAGIQRPVPAVAPPAHSAREGPRWGYRMGNAEVVDSMIQEGLTCAINGCHMGMTAEEVAKRYAVSRADQDAFAAESQRRGARRRAV